MIEFITITGSYFDAKRGKMSSTRDKRHENLDNYSALLILRCHALDSCTQSACQRFGILVPGVTPCGLTPGCTLARFQRAK